MTIAELALYGICSGWTNAGQPYFYETRPAYRQYDPYWLDIFEAPDDQKTEKIRITSFVRDSTNYYTQVYSIADCKAQEQSFYWDNDNQILYVYIERLYRPDNAVFSYGAVKGFTDDTVRYFDDIEYLPLIKKAPTYRKQVDFQNYGKLSLVNGTLDLINTGGILDELIDSPIYGNEVNILYGEEDSEYDDLIQMDTFFVEDYNWTLSSLSVKLQDQRKSQDIDIPTELFNSTDYTELEDSYEGKVIPLIYGTVRDLPCTPVDGLSVAGSTRRYRAGLLLTDLDEIYVKIDDAWISRTPSSTDLDNGEFWIPDAISDQGAPYPCKCTCTGIANTYASDVIKDLNSRFLGTTYIDSNYDTTEWEAEEVYLDPIGFVIDKKIKLFNAIASIQNGSSVGFIYEILGNGKRTIRVDNPNRDPVAYIQNIELYNIDELSIETDSSFLYSKVRAKYNRNWEAGSFLSYLNDIYESNVISTYRNRSEFEIETFLTELTAATNRANIDAENYSMIRPIAELEPMGLDYFSLRRFDIIDVELTPGFVDADNDTITGREYFGVVRGQIISIAPDYKKGINKIGLRIRPYSNVFEDIYP